MDQTYVPTEITKDEFMIATTEIKSKEEEILHRRSIEVFTSFKALKDAEDKAR